PLRDGSIVVRDAFADLHQRLLNVPRLLVVVQVSSQLLVCKLPPEPRVPPEQKWHQHDQPAGDEEKNLLVARHASFRLGLAFVRGENFFSGHWAFRKYHQFSSLESGRPRK